MLQGLPFVIKTFVLSILSGRFTQVFTGTLANTEDPDDMPHNTVSKDWYETTFRGQKHIIKKILPVTP